MLTHRLGVAFGLLCAGISCLCGCSSSNAAKHPSPLSGAQHSSPSSSVRPSFSQVGVDRTTGMTVGVADIHTLPNGLTEKEIRLRKVPSSGKNLVTYVGFHPTNESNKPPMLPPYLRSRAVHQPPPTLISVRVSSLPPGGELLACSAASDGGIDGPCTKLISSKSVNVPVAHADGVTHVAIAFRGTWPKRVVIPEIDVFYTAVDNYLVFGEDAR